MDDRTRLHEARHWRPLEGGKVVCELCPFFCELKDGKTGICSGKKNIGGKLYAINYGFTTSLNLDPIEKKPLFHFYPGTDILSIGPNGCNLSCNFCQNYQISQQSCRATYLSPDEVARIAVKQGSIGVAYTYAEPLIWFEYVMDVSREARALGLKNVLVTNGTINEKPLEEILPLTDAMNIDIKSMDPAFYRKVCKGHLDVVLNTVKKSAPVTHVEITNLVIPGLNDSDEMFEKLTDFIAEINPLMPLHFSRYHPDFKQTAPATPMETLIQAAKIAMKKLKYVYVGNVISEEYNQTRCPECGQKIIQRAGYSIIQINVKNGSCDFCGAKTGIVN